MIGYYFQLQYRMINREIREFGLNPLLAMLLGGLVFIVLSYMLYSKTFLASYIYTFIAFSFIFRRSGKHRIEWLEQNLGKQIRKLRLIENILITLPFIIFMVTRSDFVGIMILFVGVLLFSIFKVRELGNFTIPTPFYKRPYEFLVGFRRAYFAFVMVYILCGIALYVDNFALGLFACVLVFWITMAFYGEQERLYLVWMNSSNARQFLFDKIKTALIYSNILAFLLVLALMVYDPTRFYLILLVLLVGNIQLLTAVIAKYVSFPEQMNLGAAILFGIGFCLPPLLLILAPIFFKRAQERLQKILL